MRKSPWSHPRLKEAAARAVGDLVGIKGVTNTITVKPHVQFFRSLSFPKAVDAAKAKADYRNGMLRITVPIAAEARAKRVDVKAA